MAILCRSRGDCVAKQKHNYDTIKARLDRNFQFKNSKKEKQYKNTFKPHKLLYIAVNGLRIVGLQNEAFRTNPIDHSI